MSSQTKKTRKADNKSTAVLEAEHQALVVAGPNKNE